MGPVMGPWRRVAPRPLKGMSTEPPTDGGAFAWRVVVATGLWVAGAALTYGASGMSWFSEPDYDPLFADPVWGTDLLHRSTAPGAAVVVIGGLAMAWCWWASGSAGRSEGARRRRRVDLAVRVSGILRPLLAVLLLAGTALSVRGLATGWASDWVAYPGWVRSVVAQVATLVAVLLLPRTGDPRRWAEAGYGRVRVGAAALVSVATLALPLLPPLLAGATAEASGTAAPGDAGAEGTGAGRTADAPAPVTVTTSEPGASSHWVRVSAPLGSTGAAASPTTSGGGEAGAATSPVVAPASVATGAPDAATEEWWHLWRGATGAHVVPTATGNGVAVLVTNSSPQRAALAVLDRATGRVSSRWDTDDLRDRGLPPRSDSGQDTRLFGEWVVLAGEATEWTGSDGSAIGTVPTASQREELEDTEVDGLHGRSTTSATSWFVGDDLACQRRALVDASGSWVHDDDTVVGLELCTDTTPARATLLGIDPSTGEVRWRTAVPGFDTWAAGLDGPVPTLSSDAWPVVAEVGGGEGSAGGADTSARAPADGNVDEGGAVRGADPGRSEFVVEVGGTAHRIRTGSGEVLDARG